MFGGVAISSMEQGCKAELDLIESGRNEKYAKRNLSFKCESQSKKDGSEKGGTSRLYRCAEHV